MQFLLKQKIMKDRWRKRSEISKVKFKGFQGLKDFKSDHKRLPDLFLLEKLYKNQFQKL